MKKTLRARIIHEDRSEGAEMPVDSGRHGLEADEAYYQYVEEAGGSTARRYR